MAFDYLTSLSWLSLLLLVGLVVSILSKWLKLPRLVLLMVVGVGFGFSGLFDLNTEFLTSFGLFALVMIIFEATSRFNLTEMARLSPLAIKLTGVFMFLVGFVLSLVTHLFFVGWSLDGILISFLFGFLMAGTSPSTMLTMMEGREEKLSKVLEIESILNTPFIIIIPLMILYYLTGELVTTDVFLFLFRGVMAGVGTGLVLGLVGFRMMRYKYLENISPLVIIAMALVSYTLAEFIGGNGVLSVTTLGLVFGASIIKQKETMTKFVSIFTNFLTIVIFIMLGLVVEVPRELNFFLISLVLFVVYLGLRYLSIQIALKGEKLNVKEKIYMTLSVSKGIGEAVMAFVIIAVMVDIVNVNYLQSVSRLVFLFIFYSVLVSSITVRFTDWFLGGKKDD